MNFPEREDAKCERSAETEKKETRTAGHYDGENKFHDRRTEERSPETIQNQLPIRPRNTQRKLKFLRSF